MELVVFVLLLYSIKPLQTWDITENDHYDILEQWGYSRVKRTYKIQEKLESKEITTCEDMYKTDKTPFVAILLHKTSGRFLCFGSIIDPYHVLTIKKCFEKGDEGSTLILFGYYKPYWGKNSQVKRIEKVLRHEYMVALARVKRPISFSKYVRPTKLPGSYTKTEIVFKKAFPPPYKIVGFEVDRYDSPGDYLPKDVIYEIKEDNLVAFDDCKKNYSRLVLDSNKLFCTMGNATFCWGARGAPVLKWMHNLYYLQIGIVVADNCTFDTTGPLLVARTDSFGDWIGANSYENEAE